MNKRKNTYRNKALYLGERTGDLKDRITWEKNNSIPVIRNGNDPNLEASKINGKTVSLRNTCALNTIFYFTLLAANDFSHIKKKVSIILYSFNKCVLI